MFPHQPRLIPLLKAVYLLLAMPILSACGAPSGMRIGGIEYVSSEAQGKAFYAASSEAKSLPPSFDIESIYTEGAVLRNDLIMELLSERGLEFIETQIRRSTSKQYEGYGWLGMSYIRDEVGLNVGRQGMDKTYARIELSDSSDSRCIPRASLPGSMRIRLDYPPFLPDSCIAVTFIDRPTARYHLVYENTHQWGPPFGYWSLIEASSGTKLGSLTTADSAEHPQNGNTGHGFLSWRIRRTPGTFSVGPRVIAIKKLQVSNPPPTVDGTRVVSEARVRKVSVTESDYQRIFNKGNTQDGWGAAVANAKASRWGYYGYSLLDWKTKTLTQLKVDYGRGATSSAEGFFVISDRWDYRTKHASLERYDSDGNHKWSVLVKPPALDPEDTCGRGLSSVGSDKDHVIFYGRCKSQSEVMFLEISRKDLPAF